MEIIQSGEDITTLKMNRGEVATICGCVRAHLHSIQWLSDGKDVPTWARIAFRSHQPAFDVDRQSEACSLFEGLLLQMEEEGGDGVVIEATPDLLVSIVYAMQAEKQLIDEILPIMKKIAGVVDVNDKESS